MPSTPQNPSQSWVIGSAPDCTVVAGQPAVSGHHCRLTRQGDRFWIEYLQSNNGTSIDRVDNRIQRAVLNPDSDVFLGSYKISARQLLAGKKVGVGEAAFNKVSFRGNTMVIGRDPQSDLPLEFPMISWQH